MATTRLPALASLEQAQKLAKELLRQRRAGDPAALARFRSASPRAACANHRPALTSTTNGEGPESARKPAARARHPARAARRRYGVSSRVRPSWLVSVRVVFAPCAPRRA
jgi:hypothetical protein